MIQGKVKNIFKVFQRRSCFMALITGNWAESGLFSPNTCGKRTRQKNWKKKSVKIMTLIFLHITLKLRHTIICTRWPLWISHLYSTITHADILLLVKQDRIWYELVYSTQYRLYQYWTMFYLLVTCYCLVLVSWNVNR